MALVPTELPVGYVLFPMLIFVWLPFWSYRSWDQLVTDLPGTYAGIWLVLGYIAATLIDFWLQSSEMENGLQNAILDTYYPDLKSGGRPWPIRIAENLLKNLYWVIAGIYLLCRKKSAPKALGLSHD